MRARSFPLAPIAPSKLHNSQLHISCQQPVGNKFVPPSIIACAPEAGVIFQRGRRGFRRLGGTVVKRHPSPFIEIKLVQQPSSHLRSTVYSVGRQVVKTCFVICFPKVPLSCLGSMAAAVQPNGLWSSPRTFYKNLWNKLPHQTVENV